MRQAEPSLEAKVAALRDPGTYPGCDAVTAIETHMSWVFLAGDSAYKLKKPVLRPLLDFTTTVLRRAHCHAEVALNRRHTSNVYRGVVPLAATAGSRLKLRGDGLPVDWLVWARRLDQDLALDHLIRSHAEPRDRLDDVVDRLCTFYRSAERVETSPAAYTSRLGRRLFALADDLKRPALELDSECIETVTRVLWAFFEADRAEFERRARSGAIVEGHGDLRPEHVFFEDHVQIIDCLEFCRDLRCRDLADDLSLLLLECERLGAHSYGDDIVRACLIALATRPSARVMAFHTAVQALQRALLAVLHNIEPGAVDREKWRSRALTYLDLAKTWAGRL